MRRARISAELRPELCRYQTGSVSTDTEIESGTETEVDSPLPPAIRDPRLTALLNVVAQMDLPEQAKMYEVFKTALDSHLAETE